MKQHEFSYEEEREYYRRNWPSIAQPYRHLEPYLRCWMDPEAVFRENRVLDIGAGECTYTRLIADRFLPRQMVACELFLERLSPVIRLGPMPPIRFVVGDCLRLPFGNCSFDVVFGSFILHRFRDLSPVVSEIRRVLSAKGCYVGIEPNPYHPRNIYRDRFGTHSPNEYLLGPRQLAAFRDSGFTLKIQYFYPRFPSLRSRLGGTCMGVLAAAGSSIL